MPQPVIKGNACSVIVHTLPCTNFTTGPAVMACDILEERRVHMLLGCGQSYPGEWLHITDTKHLRVQKLGT